MEAALFASKTKINVFNNFLNGADPEGGKEANGVTNIFQKH